MIELKTKSESDHLILAKVALTQHWRKRSHKCSGELKPAKQRPACPADILTVPKMNFDITRSYQVVGRNIIPTTPTTPLIYKSLLPIKTRFLMDENVQLQSGNTHVAGGCSAEVTPFHNLIMVFNKPFLLMMRRDGSMSPYFALWNENAELLVAAER